MRHDGLMVEVRVAEDALKSGEGALFSVGWRSSASGPSVVSDVSVVVL